MGLTGSGQLKLEQPTERITHPARGPICGAMDDNGQGDPSLREEPGTAGWAEKGTPSTARLGIPNLPPDHGTPVVCPPPYPT